MATKTQSDLETDASGSIPDISVKSGEKGPSNPPDPKKSKSDVRLLIMLLPHIYYWFV